MIIEKIQQQTPMNNIASHSFYLLFRSLLFLLISILASTKRPEASDEQSTEMIVETTEK